MFIAILYTTAPAVGAMARLNLIDTLQIGPVGAPDGNLRYEDRPRWFRTWEETGLLTYEDRNDDGRIQYYDDGNEAFADVAESYGWNGNELSVDRDIMVLANPEIAQLPDWVIALVAAGGIAAALSTAAGLLLVISSSISHDLLKGIIMPGIGEREELMAGRLAAAVAILIAGYLGYDPPGFVAQVVAFAFGLAAASLFPAILMGIFSMRINKQGAIAGMLTGLIFTFAYILVYKGVFFEPLRENIPANWLLGISPEGIGVVGMMLNLAVATVVSRLGDPPSAAVREMIESIRAPDSPG
jgi:cation/acetate symporter